jgi:hypothetical protein
LAIKFYRKIKMYCRKRGNQVNDGSKIFPDCSTKILNLPTEQTDTRTIVQLIALYVMRKLIKRTLNAQNARQI